MDEFIMKDNKVNKLAILAPFTLYYTDDCKYEFFRNI